MLAPSSMTTRTTKTVLIIEDDWDLRELYAATLRRCGHRVIETGTVRDAEDAVSVVTPNAVVLDCCLPDGDGLDLVNRWRIGDMQRVPVIVVTAYHGRQEIVAAVLAGADVFVPKPCPTSVLAAHVDRAINSTSPTRRMRAVVVA